MKAGWELFRLGDLTDLITKGTTPTSVGFDFTINGVNFIKVESLTENGCFIDAKLASISEKCHQALARSQIKEGDILFSIAGALGRTAIVPASILPANTNQALSIIRLKKSENILPKFIFTALGTGFLLEQIDKFKGGVAQQNLSLAQVRDFQIPIPPAVEQQRIVTILDQAFEGIAKARTKAEQNLQNARALFESHLQSVFNLRGESWIEKSLSDIGITKTGSTPKALTKGSYGNFMPFIKPADFRKDGSLNYENDGLSKLGADAARKISAGSVLMVCIGATIGKCGFCDKEVTTNQQINSLTPIKGIKGKFIYYEMLTNKFQNSVLHSSGQATLPIINKSKWSALKVSIPNSLSEQVNITNKLDLLLKETQRLEALYQRKIALLDELKKSLLQQAFAGEL